MSADLLRDSRIERSSCFGSHSHLHHEGREIGLGPLLWRQFSDWKPAAGVETGWALKAEHPLFEKVLSLEETGLGRKEVLRYEWRPDGALCVASFGALWARSVSGYVGRDCCYARLRLRNHGASGLRVIFSGRLSPHATWRREGGKGLRLELRAFLPTLDGLAASPLRKSFELNASGLRFRRAGPRGYEAFLTLAPGQERGIDILLTDGSDPPAAARVRASPERARKRLKREIESWLAECPWAKSSRGVARAWYLLWNNALGPEGLWDSPVISPSRCSYGRGVWLWDSGFHALALAAGGPRAAALGKSQVLALLRRAGPDGRVPREVWAGMVHPGVQPPGILAWAALELFGRAPDPDFLAEVYAASARNHAWFYERRDLDGDGLCEWSGSDSGWDNSPRWDAGPMAAVDLNCWLKLEADCLAAMAERLALPAEAEGWRLRAERAARLVRAELWDEEAGLFLDLDPRSRRLSRVKTPAAFWPLFTGVASQRQAARLARGISADFSAPFPLPSVAPALEAFDPERYWRGPVWVNLNWLTALGLERYGFAVQARRLRRKTVDLILAGPTPREYYHPLTGQGLGAQDFAWSGAVLLLASMSERTSQRPGPAIAAASTGGGSG